MSRTDGGPNNNNTINYNNNNKNNNKHMLENFILLCGICIIFQRGAEGVVRTQFMNYVHFCLIMCMICICHFVFFFFVFLLGCPTKL